MKITELKRQLNAMDKAELISILCKLYKANKQCQAILDVEVCGASGSSTHRIVQEENPRRFLRETAVAKKRTHRNQRFPKSIAK